MAAEHVVLASYVTCLVLLAVFSLSIAHLGLVVRRARTTRPDDAPAPPRAPHPVEGLPRVTVQLPLYNEVHVARRVVDAAAALEYPRDRFRVQVLDDSTDGTSAVVDAAAAAHRAAGTDVTVVRRPDRRGYKAGALAHGLTVDDAELLLVLDADFVPQPTLVHDLLAGFDGPDVAAVQARWGYLNAGESLLTRVEGFLLDLHFAVEQPGRALSGGLLNFNGTAGMWRRAAVEDAGGWLARTVTEDIDLSYRAQLRGWRIAYLGDVVVPSELPADMGAVRGQQHRWIKGGAQNARLHLGAVARARHLPAGTRWHGAMHLVSGSLYAVILAMLVLSVPLTALRNTAITTDYVDLGMPFVLATVALGWTLAVAQAPRGTAGWARFAGLLPAFMVLTMGLAVHNGLAALAGWRGRGGEFVRTPKTGGAAWQTTAYARLGVDRRVLLEVAFLGWLVLGMTTAWWRRDPALVPLQAMAAAGTTWVLALSLWHPVRARRAARTTRRAAASATMTTTMTEVAA